MNINDVIQKMKTFNFNYIERKKNIALFSNKIINILIDLNFPYAFFQVFSNKFYNLIKNNKTYREYTVIDIGANRGYSSLFFAIQPFINEVFAFELIPKTAEFAIKNISANKTIQSKIHFYDCGLSNKDSIVESFYFPYHDTISTYNLHFINDYVEKFCHTEPYKKIKLPIFKASKILYNIIKNRDIILKIDVEGAEDDIFEDLFLNCSEIITNIKIICGEIHSKNSFILQELRKLNYKILSDQTDIQYLQNYIAFQNNTLNI